MKRLAIFALTLGTAAISACDGGAIVGAPDVGVDASGLDASAADTGVDAVADLATDIPASDSPAPDTVVVDAPVDVASDAPADVPADVPPDAPADVASDNPTDAGTDAPGDAPAADVPPDVAPDVPVTSPFEGTVSFVEADFLNPGTAGTSFGQGLLASISFVDRTALAGTLVMETSSGPDGCKAWVYDTPAEIAASMIGIDEGPVDITTTGTGAPAVPSCRFVAGVGYQCPDPTNASTGGTISAGAGGAAVLTDGDVTYTPAVLGRHVRIAGALDARNNGLFPILSNPSTTSIAYANPLFVAETLPAAAQHLVLAAAGPIPATADPGFLPDAAAVSITHTMGGGSHVPTFTATTPASVGGDFAFAADSTTNLMARVRLTTVPRNGAAFTVTCDAASCPAGSANVTMLHIVTSNGSLAGISPRELPSASATTRRVEIRCTQASSGAGATIVVPAAYMALLMTSGATRIRTTFTRGSLLTGAPAGANTTLITGHAVVGFTNPVD